MSLIRSESVITREAEMPKRATKINLKKERTQKEHPQETKGESILKKENPLPDWFSFLFPP